MLSRPLAVPKPRPQLLAIREKHATLHAIDRKESEKAKKRANGRCECFVITEGWCQRPDSETHHLLGGNGRRLRGKSLLAIHKLRLCHRCHREITGHLLKILTGGKLPIWSDVYERIA